MPRVLLVTFTVIVQELDSLALGRAATVPPERETTVALGGALNVPPQLFCAAGLAASTRPAGKLS